MRLDCHGRTDRGRERSSNEDQFLVADLHGLMTLHQSSLSIDDRTQLTGAGGTLLVVADGMGGHVSGERASALAVRALGESVLDALPWLIRLPRTDDQLWRGLQGSFEQAEAALDADARRDVARRGMGTTLTLAYLLWPRMYVVHAGDSRCYLLREGQLTQLTRDHTVAEQLAQSGADPERVQERFGNVVSNALIAGEESEVTPEARRVDLREGDAVLLCSDGLTAHMDDDEIAAVLRSSPSAAQIVDRLIAAANERGGSDNITVVAARTTD